MSKRKHRLPWPIIIILFAGLISSLCLLLKLVLGPNNIATNSGLPSPMVRFVSKEFHIALDYPQSWFAYDLPQGNHGDMEAIAFVVHAGPAGQPNVLIAQKSFTHLTLEDVAEWGKERLNAQSSQFVIVEMDTVSKPNGEALIRNYSVRTSTPFGQYTDLCVDWYTLKNSSGYVLSFCASEKYWPDIKDVFMQMAQSFTVNQ